METYYLTTDAKKILIAVEAECYADALLVKDAIDDDDMDTLESQKAQIVGAWETQAH